VQKALPLLRRGASVILTGSMVSIKGFASCSVYNASRSTRWARLTILSRPGSGAFSLWTELGQRAPLDRGPERAAAFDHDRQCRHLQRTGCSGSV
jgi:hypothetical protein